MDFSLVPYMIGTATVPVTELTIGNRWLVRWDVTGSPFQALIAVGLGGLSLLLVGYLHRCIDRGDWTTVAVWGARGALGGAALGLWIVGDGSNSAVAVARAAVGGGFAGMRIRQTRQALARSDRDRHWWKSLFAKAPTAVADPGICENAFFIVTVNDEFRNHFGLEVVNGGEDPVR